jgi:hypothetical protein
MAVSKELQALNDALARKAITPDQYSKQFLAQANVDSTARAEQLRASKQPSTAPVKGSDFVKMWTGDGIASVNPNFVAQKQAEGFSTTIPTQDEMSKLIEMARRGEQGTFTPGVGVGAKIPAPTQTVQPTSGINQTMQQTLQPTNQNGMISDMYKGQTDALVAQIRANIARATQGQRDIIGGAQQRYDPLRAQSELTREQQLRSTLERNANLGDRGGVGRIAALETQTAGANRLNSIDLQQQNLIDSANQEIANLESQGRFEEASVIASQRAQELQALLENQRYQSEISRADQIRQDDLARQEQIRQEGLTAQSEAQSRNDFQNQILANYMDLAGFAQRLRSSGAPQWQIDQVEAARVQKVIENNLNPSTGLANPVDTTPNITSSTAALTLWEQLGVANEAVSRALGIPVGTPFTPQYTGGSSGGGGGSQFNPMTTPQPEALPPKEAIAIVTDAIRGVTGPAAADVLEQMNQQGYFDNLTASEIKSLMNKAGVTDLQLEQAYNRATQPIILPSCKGVIQGANAVLNRRNSDTVLSQ